MVSEKHKVILGEIIKIHRGASPRPIQKYLTNSSDGINWIKIGDVGSKDKYIKSTSQKITLEGAINSRRVYKGDFLLSNSMSFGRPYILGIDGAIHDGWLVLQEYEEYFDIDFLYYYLSSDIVINQYKSKAAGSSVLNLNKDLVSSVEVEIPDIKEQNKISKILSDIDQLINSLSELIKKKQSIKKGAMQDLITGKMRLNGFEKKWRILKLEKVLKIRNGRNQKAVEEKEGKYPILATGGEIGRTNTPIYDKESVLIGRKGTIDRPQYMVTPFWTVDTLFYSELFDETDVKFIYYLFQMIPWKSFNASTGVPSLTSSIIHSIEVKIPELDEQKAVANVISDMDEEIFKLEEKLEKYKKIKQGMMEQLLTGKIQLA